MERTEVVAETTDYTHAVCRSKGVGFKDDVEFHFCVEVHPWPLGATHRSVLGL